MWLAGDECAESLRLVGGDDTCFARRAEVVARGGWGSTDENVPARPRSLRFGMISYLVRQEPFAAVAKSRGNDDAEPGEERNERDGDDPRGSIVPPLPHLIEPQPLSDHQHDEWNDRQDVVRAARAAER